MSSPSSGDGFIGRARPLANEHGRDSNPPSLCHAIVSWPPRAFMMSHSWALWGPWSLNGWRTHWILARGKWRWGGRFIHPFFIILACLYSWMSTLAWWILFVSFRSDLNEFLDWMLCQSVGRWVWCIQRWTLPWPASNVLMFISAYFCLQNCFIYL